MLELHCSLLKAGDDSFRISTFDFRPGELEIALNGGRGVVSVLVFQMRWLPTTIACLSVSRLVSDFLALGLEMLKKLALTNDKQLACEGCHQVLAWQERRRRAGLGMPISPTTYLGIFRIVIR